jgi:hypothetical protein
MTVHGVEFDVDKDTDLDRGTNMIHSYVYGCVIVSNFSLLLKITSVASIGFQPVKERA